MVAERGEGANALHNMSAPPRSVVSVNGLRCGDEAKASDSGLMLVGRFDLGHAWASVLDAEKFLRYAGGSTTLLNRRMALTASVALARAVDGDTLDAALRQTDATSDDALEDELLARIANWKDAAAGLPCIAFVEEMSFNPDVYGSRVPLDASPARTLHVLTHLRGGLYLRDEAPTGFQWWTVLRSYALLVPRVGARP
jgi:hypothetical protein